VTAGGSSNNDSSGGITAPYFVKIERVGNSFTGSISATGDPNDWTQLGDAITLDVADMNDPVLIGLAATSHAAGELRTFTLDSIAGTGNITGDYAVADIGVAQGGNDPAPVYVTLVDAAGNSAKVSYPGNPGLTLATDWVDWKILTSEFSGVDRKAITQMIVGIGDGQADGTGTIQVANVRVVKPITINVVNNSFEQPNPTKDLLYPGDNVRFQNIPGWGTSATHAGISSSAKATNGKWAALLLGGDPGIWQVTDHTIVNGEAFTLTVDAAVVVGAIRDSKSNLKISLFYYKDNSRVSLGSKSFKMPLGPKAYTLDVSASDARKGAGYKLGVEIANVMDNRIGVDNVRLKTK